MKTWLISEGLAFALGLVFVLIGAEMNSPGAEPATPDLAIGLALIAVSLAGAVVTVIAAAAGYNFAAHPEVKKGRPLPWILTLLGCLIVTGVGAAVIIGLSGQGGPAGKAATSWGVFLILSGLAAWLTRLVIGFRHVTRPQREAYRRWKESLTPEQRAGITGTISSELSVLYPASHPLFAAPVTGRRRSAGLSPVSAPAGAGRCWKHRAPLTG